jgi:PKD repeat protein
VQGVSLLSPAVRLAVGAAAVVLAFLWAPVAARADTPPVAAFAVNPAAPAVGERVAFADRSLDAEGPIANHEWDLDGDGTFERVGPARVSRRFFRAACFTIRLRVTDGAGNSAQAIKVVAVSAPPAPAPVCPPPPDPPPPVLVTPPPVQPPATPPANQAPSAAFAFSPLAPQVGEAVGFAATAEDPDGTVAAYAWDLDGDGAFDDASGPTAQTTYATAGSRTVSLQVVDDGGLATVTARTVAVTDAPGGGVLGASARPQRLSPFPVVRLSGTVRGRVVRVRRLIVDAPDGVTISVRCYGRGCPSRRPLTRTLFEGRIVRVRKLERRLRPGIVIKILVTRQGWIGKYTRFRIRTGKPPSRQDRCVSYGRTRPRSCSTS